MEAQLTQPLPGNNPLSLWNVLGPKVLGFVTGLPEVTACPIQHDLSLLVLW